MLISAYGASKDQWVWAVATQYRAESGGRGSREPGLPEGNYASVFYPVAQEFAGVGIKNLFKVLIITGSFACSLAFWQTSNRYLFAMGRERLLPRILGRTHRTHKSPYVRRRSCSCSAVAMTSLFAFDIAGGGQREKLGIDEGSPITALLQIGTWMPFQGNMLLFPLMALVSLAIIIFFLRPENRDGFHWWKTLVAPILGAGSLVFAFYLMMQNRGALTIGEYKGWTYAVPFYALGIFLGGCLARRHLLLLVEGAVRGGGQVRPRGGLGGPHPSMAGRLFWAAPLV